MCARRRRLIFPDRIARETWIFGALLVDLEEDRAARAVRWVAKGGGAAVAEPLLGASTSRR